MVRGVLLLKLTLNVDGYALPFRAADNSSCVFPLVRFVVVSLANKVTHSLSVATSLQHEPVYLNQNEGFIVAYSIDDCRTFETAKQLIKLIRELKKQKGLQTSIVLVGNKVDLSHSRKVSKKEARLFASTYECAFHETSAATNVKVKNIFHDAVRQLRVLQFSRKANQGPIHSIKNFFSKIKVED